LSPTVHHRKQTNIIIKMSYSQAQALYFPTTL